MEAVTETMLESSTILEKSDNMGGMAFEEIAGIFISIFLVGIIGNSIVIYVLFRKRRTWNVTTTYLFNLSLADAVFVCTLPLWAQTYLNRMEWKFGLVTCKLVGVVTSLNMYASIFFLTAMSVDRWIAVVHATTVNTVRNSVMARFTCAAVWITALLFCIPRMLYQTTKTYDIGGGSQGVTIAPSLNITGSLELGTETTPMQSTEYSSSTQQSQTLLVCIFFLPITENKKMLNGLMEFIEAIIGFIIPMIIICVCYIRIVHTVRLKLISKRVRKERVAILAALIVTAFFVCWLPKQFMTLYSALGGWWDLVPFNEQLHQAVYPFCVCLAYLNSCVNPFVYAFTATNFKNSVKEVCGSNAGGYKMKLTGTGCSPCSPNGKSIVNKKGLSSLRSKKRRSCPDKEGDFKDMHQNSPRREVQEPLNAAIKINGVDDYPPGEYREVRFNPECEHLRIDETTSGVYYEYFSSPPVLETVPEKRPHKVTTRADILNHNGTENSNETHHEWYPPHEVDQQRRVLRVVEEAESVQ